MTFVSHAQNFEDVLLWRALHGIKKGRYLDIGAQDPVVDSVSLAFYQSGWRGIHVEPVPYYADRLREERPDETVIQAAVTDAVGPIAFFEIPATGISTGKSEIASQHADDGYESQKVVVPTTRLDQIFDLGKGDIHWMKIDVEGMEREVLRSWGGHLTRPWILVIESTYPGTEIQTHEKWLGEVLDRGYSDVFFDGLNRYFVHEAHAELGDKFDRPPNVLDVFAVAEHHFSVQQLRAQFNEREQRAVADEIQRREHERATLTARMQEADRSALEAQQQANQALQKLIAAEQAHRISLEGAWRDRQSSEEQLRSEVRTTEKIVQKRLEHTEQQLASAGAQSARLEERLSEREQQLASAGAQSARLEERLSEREQQLASAERARLELGEAHSKLEREAQELRLRLSEAERDRADAQRRADDETARRISGESERDESRSKAAAAEEQVAQLTGQIAETEGRLNQLEAKLRAEIASYQAQLTRLREVVARAAAERQSLWQRIGLAAGFGVPGPAWKALKTLAEQAATEVEPAAIADQSFSSSTTGADRSMEPATAEPGNPYLRANSLPELLSWHDVDFVRCAYVTVLGRQPDADGEAYYLRRIREGHSKLAVLRQLRRSDEGRSHDPGIGGFDRALRKAAWTRKRLAGPLLRLFVGGEGDGRLDRELRALANRFAVSREKLLREIAAARAEVGRQSQELTELRSRYAEVCDRISELQHSFANVSAGVQQQSNTPTSTAPVSPDGRSVAPIAERLFSRIRSVAQVGD